MKLIYSTALQSSKERLLKLQPRVLGVQGVARSDLLHVRVVARSSLYL